MNVIRAATGNDVDITAGKGAILNIKWREFNSHFLNRVEGDGRRIAAWET